MKNKFYIFLSLLILCAGIFIGFFIGRNTSKGNSIEVGQSEVRLGGYKYINPLLVCENSGATGESEYKPSKQKILDFINAEKDKKTISDVAVYYRDLNNGPWFGINERDNFAPASLLKLPVMMAYFKKAESDSSVLVSKLKFIKRNELIQPTYVSHIRLEENKLYTVEELIGRMIVQSDNDALFLLQDNIDNSQIDKVTMDLGIETVKDDTIDDYMSVKSYASLLRVLFNASYLNKNYSEKALELLAKTSFDKGIKRGIPNDVVVAHKFGERGLANGIQQLHDCGIVYYPKHPYLVCIMTRGKNYDSLSQTIGKISYQIYDDIKQRFKK